MAKESFEDPEVAKLLNRYCVCIKVDREERPDIDGVYMAVCQEFTGGGGWPTSVFMTADQQPFFAGTYFPKTARFGAPGFMELVEAIHEKWQTDRGALIASAREIVSSLEGQASSGADADESLIEAAVKRYKRSYDAQYGGFGVAPKFPAPHNLLFLLAYYERRGDHAALEMAETTLRKMYLGGLFDHIGFGFSRYSTDRFFLAPHFEKMLCDNALLIMAYSTAYSLTKKPFYRDVAERTAKFLLDEMTGPDGGFYSAQDADSDGVEGGYYLFEPSEIVDLLGRETGDAFNRHYGIAEGGNFNGKSIPNLLFGTDQSGRFEPYLPMIRQYRRHRAKLHLDDKILTAWNALTIAAMALLYRVSGKGIYLEAAERAQRFIERELCADGALFVSFRDGRRGAAGFLDDYALYAFGLIFLYEATLDQAYLGQARRLCQRAVSDFYDEAGGGFYQSGKGGERLIFRPKDTYDGAIPSGNSVMAYNLVRLSHLAPDGELERLMERQLAFVGGAAWQYPPGHAMGLAALLDHLAPPPTVTIVPKEQSDLRGLPLKIRPGSAMIVREGPSDQYPLLNDRTTFYVCRDRACLPPGNDPESLGL